MVIDTYSRQRLDDERRTKALVEGMKESIIQAFRSNSENITQNAEVLKLVVKREEDQRVVTILEKIGKALVVIYNHLKKPVELPKVFKVDGRVEVSKMPSVYIRNFEDMAKYFEDLKNKLQGLTYAITQVPQPKIEIPKITVPKQEIRTDPKLIELLGEVSDAVTSLRKMKFEVPNTIQAEVVNFPPQHIPTPVTHVNINSLIGSALATAVTVGTIATPLPATPLSFRRSLIVFNNSNSTIYLGGSAVTTSTGLPVASQSYSPALDSGSKMIIYGIAASPGLDVRVFEVSDEDSGR